MPPSRARSLLSHGGFAHPWNFFATPSLIGQQEEMVMPKSQLKRAEQAVAAIREQGVTAPRDGRGNRRAPRSHSNCGTPTCDSRKRGAQAADRGSGVLVPTYRVSFVQLVSTRPICPFEGCFSFGGGGDDRCATDQSVNRRWFLRRQAIRAPNAACGRDRTMFSEAVLDFEILDGPLHRVDAGASRWRPFRTWALVH
jgi:hypothetical protein